MQIKGNRPFVVALIITIPVISFLLYQNYSFYKQLSELTASIKPVRGSANGITIVNPPPAGLTIRSVGDGGVMISTGSQQSSQPEKPHPDVTEKTRRKPDKISAEDAKKFLANLPKDTEVHSIGVYEGKGRDQNGICKIYVDITLKKTPIILFLNSYAEMDWILTAGTDVDLKGILVKGHHVAELINVPENVPVYFYDQVIGNTFNGTLYAPNSANLEIVQRTLQSKGLSLTSFQGSYSASWFTIDDNSVAKPQVAYSWPKNVVLPEDAEIQVVSINEGQLIQKPIKYDISIDGDNGKVRPNQYATVKLPNSNKPLLVVLSSKASMVWYIENLEAANLKGVILAGPGLQYLASKLDHIPLVLWNTEKAGLYDSDEYKSLAKKISDTFNKQVTGYTGVNKADKTIEVNLGSHFITAEETEQQTGIIKFPDNAQTWIEAGEQTYQVPQDCGRLHAMAWGGGGAGGSWSGSSSGGGGAFVYESWDNLSGKTLKFIIGGGGKVGMHRHEKDGERILPSPGKGGYPDGGNGGTGYDGTGGGGGGATRIIQIENNKQLLVAGAGGGGTGGGFTGSFQSGKGGSALESGSTITLSGKTGADGKGGDGGYNPSDSNDINTSGESGTTIKGGSGRSIGGRIGAGGGGGGYGGGGGGACLTATQDAGSGGGGGSLGSDIRPGTTNVDTSGSIASRMTSVSGHGTPGNAAQAGTAGYGGAIAQPGNDGKVIIWCEK